MGNYEINWSPTASITYIYVLEYLQENWPEKVLEDFIIRTKEILKHISNNPHLYIYSKDLSAYRCVIVKQISLFYRVVNDTKIELLTFWDNRRALSDLLIILA